MMKIIDSYLDRITMYRLVLYYLIGLVLAAAALSAAGILKYDAFGLLFSAGYMVLVCVIANWVFAKTFNASTNPDSAYITGLILALIITPIQISSDIVFFTAAAGLAIASKYLLAIGRKHVFNPAAIAVVLTAAGAGQAASWWVGNAAMLPFVLVGGLLLIRRLREWGMVLTFFAAAAITISVIAITSGNDPVIALQKTLLATAVLFLGFVMLTEPQTAPRTRGQQLWFAGIVGVLFAPQLHIGSVFSTPELALIVGNVYTWFVSPRFNASLQLASKHRLSSRVSDFVFAPATLPAYLPGQYMEWTLPHTSGDSHGDRRFFTLASSPTEPDLRIGVKFYPDGSTYKRALQQLPAGGHIKAAQISGDFVLPRNSKRKLAFIAGGIGVTPYRSMVKYLLDTGQKRDIKLLYVERAAEDFVYTDVFSSARDAFGLAATYLVSTPGANLDPHMLEGRITAETIQAEIPDFAERLFYISGPQAMVHNVQTTLKKLGVPTSQIKTDYFTGYELV